MLTSNHYTRLFIIIFLISVFICLQITADEKTEGKEIDSEKTFKMNPDLVELADNTWLKMDPKFVYHPDQLKMFKKAGRKLKDLPFRAGGKFGHFKGEGSFCYDESTNLTLYFGGCTSGYGNNHWVYNCSKNTWTQIHPDIFKIKDKIWRYREDTVSHPPGCCSYGICYDSDAKVSVLSRSNGGATAWTKSPGPKNNIIWLYNATTKRWGFTKRNGKIPKVYLTGTRLAYNPVKKECILFSGPGPSLWAYKTSTNTWRKIETGELRPKKGGNLACWIYLEKDKKFLLFGGRGPKIKDTRTTWLFDPATEKWEDITPKEGPTMRVGAAAAYDSLNNVVVMIGGWSIAPSKKINDGTFIFDPVKRTWQQHKLKNMPKITGSCYQMSYDKVNNVTIYVTGGVTWVYRYSKNKNKK